MLIFFPSATGCGVQIEPKMEEQLFWALFLGAIIAQNGLKSNPFFFVAVDCYFVFAGSANISISDLPFSQ